MKTDREVIIDLLKSTGREGVEELIKSLDEHEFFTRKGSYRHHKYEGGLAKHSLGVCELALKLNKNCDINSVIISSLLHDICKGRYPGREHGAKSVNILDNIIKFPITDEERRAIRFHMSQRNARLNQTEMEQWNIAENESLRNLIHICDCIDGTTNYIRGILGAN